MLTKILGLLLMMPFCALFIVLIYVLITGKEISSKIHPVIIGIACGIGLDTGLYLLFK